MRAILLVVLLAGCAAAPGPEAAPIPAASPPTTLTFGSCVDIASYFQVQVDVLASEVPAPLTPTTIGDAGVIGQRWIVAAQCEILDANWTGGPVTFFLDTIKVDAPERPGPDDRRVAGGSFVRALTVDRHDLADAIASWGMTGQTVAEVAFAPPDATLRTAARAGPDGPEMAVLAAGPPISVGVEHERFFLPDGEGGIGGAFDLITRPGTGELGPATYGEERPGRGGWFSGDEYGYALAMTPAEWLPAE